MAYFRAAIGGGGGNGFPYTVQGTLPDFTANNQEQTVSTGLSSVKYFYVEGFGNNGANYGMAWLDKDRTWAKQVASYSTASSTQATNSGTSSTGVITGNTAHLKISGISGGNVTVKCGNGTATQYKNCKWYAG